LAYDEEDDNLKKIFEAKLKVEKEKHKDAATVTLKLPLGVDDLTA
jgi:hypothetical protein